MGCIILLSLLALVVIAIIFAHSKPTTEAEKGPSPCGDKYHWYWEVDTGCECPVCAGTHMHENAKEEKERLDREIADFVTEQLNKDRNEIR